MPLLALALLAGLAAAAPKDVVVTAAGLPAGGVQVAGEFSAPVPAAVAWEVLTDYGELPRFVSSLRESRLVSRWRGGGMVRQASRLEWLMLRKTVSVTLRVRENAPAELAFEDEARGDVRRYCGSWRITPSKSSVSVRYRLETEPKEWLPPFVWRRALAEQAEAALGEIRREMMRRALAKEEIARRFRGRR